MNQFLKSLNLKLLLKGKEATCTDYLASLLSPSYIALGFSGGSEVKVSASNAGDPGLIPESGRFPGEGNGNPLRYSCLENPMDRGAWRATVHGVEKGRTRLSDFTSLLHYIA